MHFDRVYSVLNVVLNVCQLYRHGGKSGNGKPGMGIREWQKGVGKTGLGKAVFFPVTGNDHFSRREFPIFSRPAILLKNN